MNLFIYTIKKPQTVLPVQSLFFNGTFSEIYGHFLVRCGDCTNITIASPIFVNISFFYSVLAGFVSYSSQFLQTNVDPKALYWRISLCVLRQYGALSSKAFRIPENVTKDNCTIIFFNGFGLHSRICVFKDQIQFIIYNRSYKQWSKYMSYTLKSHKKNF